MFIFRDGQGADGNEPPNNWQSHFGGSAWTRITEPDGAPGQWYLHLFDSSQPDFNWDNQAVHDEFERILRFWLDRGVSGFRVDVAHALVKAPGLPAWGGRADGSSSDGFPGHEAPMFGQPALHDIYRAWRRILEEYGPDRILCAEANVDPLPRLAHWVRPDEMHQAFNFPYLHAGLDVLRLRHIVTESLTSLDAVGAPSTWVLSNHDVVRHATRFGYDGPGRGTATASASATRSRTRNWAGPGQRRHPCSCSGSPGVPTCTKARNSDCLTASISRTTSGRTRRSRGQAAPGWAATAAGFRCPGEPSERNSGFGDGDAIPGSRSPRASQNWRGTRRPRTRRRT